MKKFNEDSRVKIPTILHLTRLGYDYLPLKDAEWNTDTNIFTDVFIESITKINNGLALDDAKRLLDDVGLLLDNEDLGKAFYERLTEQSGIKLIDFENFENNTFNVVTELTYKKDEDEFRPDIILLVNGMPLVFIEVKKPNNLDGVQAEHKRMATRFQNKKFRKFINITQLMVFSNNMEYDDGSPLPIQGAFYATTSYHKPVFNYFREEDDLNLAELLSPENDTVENIVLKDNNLVGIKNSAEFLTNKNSDSPTNRICTSLFSKDRLAFALQYAVAYVNEFSGLQKHVMRYPQLFATKAIEKSLDNGINKGIIWHTQGSGKTALTYFNVKYLTDYYQQKGIVPKFYFIVDRLDLLVQAGKEFRSRGLVVHNVNSRDEFARTIKSTKAIENNSGKPEITVVNIQKFKDDPNVVKNTDYNLNLQRVYFLDEVHRSYNPKGSFLANLRESDPNSIKIGLTGTPLIGDDLNSKMLFGDYIHKYYYNRSIADGYTLRLIREEIATSYKLTLQKALESIKVLQGNVEKKKLYADPRFVEPMLDYIVEDFENGRISMNDNSIGAMVICDSSDQAKEMQTIFNKKYAEPKAESEFAQLSVAAEPKPSYGEQRKADRKIKTSAVILHDVGSKQDRKEWVDEFKDGKIDIIFVYNMLLTGFDAKRLKKLYIGRVIKSHNLLQALTRVNRTYKEFRYGYVVDFADIQGEFDKTNQAYFNELQAELGDEMELYSDLFLSASEIEEQIEAIKDILFPFDTSNAETFSQQISKIEDRVEMLKITKALNNAKSLYNLIRLSGNYDLLEQLDFRKLTVLSREAQNHLSLINTKVALENTADTTNLLNTALEDVIFAFTKVGESEMVLADELKDTLRKTREGLAGNFDQKDPVFISLKEELERLFKKKNLNEVTKEEMEANIEALKKIHEKSNELARTNNLIKAKYENDEKYARIHKRLMEKNPLTDSERKLFEVLCELKEEVDNNILQNAKMLENESFVNKMISRLVVVEFKKKNIPLDLDKSKRIINLVTKEYMNEYNGQIA